MEEDGQQEGSGRGGEGWQAAIEWDGIAKLLVSEEARMEFSSLRRAFDEITHALHTEVGQGFFLSFLFFLFIIIIIVFLYYFCFLFVHWYWLLLINLSV